jgi:hypothetical protein
LGKRTSLLYTDTDSFCFELKSADLEKDIKKIQHRMDFSNFPSTHSWYDNKNCAKLGFFKFELGAHKIISTIFIKPNCYNLLLKVNFFNFLKMSFFKINIFSVEY